MLSVLTQMWPFAAAEKDLIFTTKITKDTKRDKWFLIFSRVMFVMNILMAVISLFASWTEGKKILMIGVLHKQS